MKIQKNARKTHKMFKFVIFFFLLAFLFTMGQFFVSKTKNVSAESNLPDLTITNIDLWKDVGSNIKERVDDRGNIKTTDK